jgi:hypothetical protein
MKASNTYLKGEGQIRGLLESVILHLYCIHLF